MRIYQAINWQKNSIKKLLKNLKKTKVQSLFIDNIWGADLKTEFAFIMCH